MDAHGRRMPGTLVSFHAHPDDESLLTGGTLAKAAAEGHRVVLVTATDGAAGLTSADVGALGPLGRTRLDELHQAAEALGVHRVVTLGYTDGAFSEVPVAVAAERLAQVLREEQADVLTGYDAAGGYGHPDHVHVHHVARAAALLARTPVLLEATIDRRLLLRVVCLLRFLPRSVSADPRSFETAYTHRSDITHIIDVRAHLAAKTAALGAHHSQTVGAQKRTVGLLLGLPHTLLAPVLGREWFTEVGRPPRGRPIGDVFADDKSSGGGTRLPPREDGEPSS